jgi:ABC-type antimicrobial peptide transport system permease subunit
MCIIAVAISTALLVSLLSVAEGIWENASYSVLTSKEDLIIIPQLPGGSGTQRGISNGHKIANEIKSDQINISEVSPMYTGILNIFNDHNNDGYSPPRDTNLTINSDIDDLITNLPSVVISIGIIPERFEKFFADENTYNYGIIEFKFDDWFETSGDPHYDNDFSGPWTYEILIDEHLAEEYNLKRGSFVNLSISTEPVTFKVSGVFKTNLKEQYFEDYFSIKGLVILHLSEYQSLVGDDIITNEESTVVVDNVNTIAIYLNPDRPDEYAIDDVAFSVQEKYPLLEIVTKEEQLESLEEQNAMTRVFYTSISIVSIIIGLLFVACIMLISVYERINEIGMLRAIGISRTTIFKWVLLESLLLIIIGILVGFLPGYIGAELLSDYIGNDIGIEEDLTAFSPSLIIWSFFSMLALGMLISLIPAIRASIMKVTEAISFVR